MVLMVAGERATVIGVITTVIESVSVVDSAVGAESVTFTVNVEVPALVGVPAMVPEVPKVKPAGNDPVPATRLQVRVPVPPLAARVELYAPFNVPLGSEVV